MVPHTAAAALPTVPTVGCEATVPALPVVLPGATLPMVLTVAVLTILVLPMVPGVTLTVNSVKLNFNNLPCQTRC
jgi:hypothetical protein